MKIVAVGGLAAIACAVSFFAGVVWADHRLLTRETLQLLSAVEVRVDPSAGGITGRMPSGTTLYAYETFGETSIYAIFIEMKQRDVLAPTTEQRAIVKPLHVLPE